ncbi:MAG: glycoside hydrolase family 99-like domain-containing protein [Actinobacteria bacterium]|nr:glycoside hydrolase family 99-like domain-containing protein [Actinomycetota bacterium]
MKLFLRRIISTILIVIIIFALIFLLYFIESRFFILGKISYPLYVSYNTFYEKMTVQKDKYEDTIVYCDYYTWHNEKHWQRGHSNEPVLGFYDSLDPEVIAKHIDWTNGYGIDVLKIEYIPQFDDSIINGIFKKNLNDTKICLMYDSMLRFESIGYKNPPYDFNDKIIANTFIEDMEHIADTYFSSDNYFRIDNKPVLWIYVTRDFTGNYREVIEKVRQNFYLKGYKVYLVGDVVFWDYKLNKIMGFDAVSCYSAYAGRPQNTAEYTERLKFLYMVWKTSASSLKVDFIPAGIPAYNDTCLSTERICVPPLKGLPEEFRYQLEVISQFCDPVNISPNINQVSLATFNEHQEGSSLEPSLEWGFERIKQVPEVFGYN